MVIDRVLDKEELRFIKSCEDQGALKHWSETHLGYYCRLLEQYGAPVPDQEFSRLTAPH